jgi:hypothetical protein
MTLDKDEALTMLIQNFTKLEKAFKLVAHSTERLSPIDPKQSYSIDDLEPYDALSARFERVVEACFKNFKSIEAYEYGKLDTTLRDKLNTMSKLSIINDVGVWLEMRDYRNKAAHDYIENFHSKLLEAVKGQFLVHLSAAVNGIRAKYHLSDI